MILTCPNCATRYLVEEGEIRPEGRKVRCSSCAQEWRVYPEGSDPQTPITPVVEASAEPVSEPFGVAPPDPSESPIEEIAVPAFVEREPDAPVLDEAAAPAEAPIVAPILDGPRATPSRSGVPSWGLIALIVLALVVGLFGFRREIVRAWPAAAGFYGALHISAAPPAASRPNG